MVALLNPSADKPISLMTRNNREKKITKQNNERVTIKRARKLLAFQE